MSEKNNPYLIKNEIKRLLILFIPILGASFSNYAFIFLEKLFLSRISEAAIEAAINSAYVGQMFQMASIALVMMAQVFVGRLYGSREFHSIGPGIWQFIWFSFLSMIITVPGSLLYGFWYFHGTEIEGVSQNYLYILTATNFLYPLGITLSSYFLGQGMTKFVLTASLLEQVIKIILAYLLIFGINGWIPVGGILGGVISNAIVHAIFCIVLGAVFLSKKQREISHSNKWKFQPNLFWNCIKPGLYSCLNRIISVLSWGAIARLMVVKGGSHLLILSLGGSLVLFLFFLFEAIFQAQTIIISQHIGAKRFYLLSKTIHSGLILVLFSALILAIPFISFPIPTFHKLFPDIILESASIQYLFFGVWIWIIYVLISAIPISFLIAFKDTRFYMVLGSIFCVSDYLLMYFFIEKVQISPQLFWAVLCLVQMTGIMPIHFWRMRVLNRRQMASLYSTMAT